MHEMRCLYTCVFVNLTSYRRWTGRGPTASYLPTEQSSFRNTRLKFIKASGILPIILENIWRIFFNLVMNSGKVSTYIRLGLGNTRISTDFVRKLAQTLVTRATLHMSQEPWPRNCESPEGHVQRPYQDTSDIMKCGHAPSSVVWSRMWPGPHPNAISMDFYSYRPSRMIKYNKPTVVSIQSATVF